MPITYDQTGVTYDASAYTYNGDGFQPTVFPVAGVYIAFTDGPYVASPAWTEVSTYVRGITTHRGRSSDFDQFDTGTAQIVLDNRDRRFDPFYTSGPYYPNGLTPRRPIRIVGQIGGSTYEVFRGFVAGWPVTWSEAGYDSTVTIQCFDALGLMANEVVPTDWPEYVTRGYNPTRYFRCNDSATTNVAIDQITNGTVKLTNYNAANYPNQFETTSLADALPSKSLFFARYKIDDTSIAQTYDFTWSFCAWLKGNGESGATFNLFYVGFGNVIWRTRITTAGLSLSIVTGNLVGSSDVYTITIDAAYVPAFGQPFHLAAVNNPTTRQAPTIYINGVSVPYTSAFFGTAAYPNYLNIEVQNLQMQELAFFRYLLTAAQVQAIYNAGRGRISESTSARMQRLLDTTDWPAALESFPASPVGTVAEIGSGTGVVPELQLVADSEGGELYVSKTGVLTMTARRDVFNATRSANVQATLSMVGDPGINYGTELNIEYDADNLKNDITVNYSGDGEVNLYNDVVITGYGAAATTIETQLDSPTSALDLATLELGVEGVLVPQISPIDVSPNTDPADWQTVLGLELLDRVEFQFSPSVGTAFIRPALINAIDHQIEPGVWRTQLTLSMRYTSPLTLDDPVLGRLDYNYLG